MKKVYGLALMVLLTVLAAAGCNSGGGETQPAQTQPAPTQPASEQVGSGQQEAVKEEPKTDFPTDDIEFIVGANPGGGYSTWGQAISQFMEKYLPNETEVVVRHMPEAGGVTAANTVQAAKPDGHLLKIYNLPGLAPTQLAKEVNYDLTKVTWLATVNKGTYTVSVSPESGYKSLEDLKKKDGPILVATRGLASNDTVAAAIVFKELGIDWKPLTHGGTGEVILSVVRGDADVVFSVYESVQESLKAGDLEMILHFGDEPHPDYPNVPISDKVGLSKFNDLFSINRVIGGPPGIPEDVVAILEKAIKESVEDPEFVEMMNKQNLAIHYEDAARTNQIVSENFENFSQYADIVKELYSQN